jgi:hypothetical protein
MVGVPVGVHDMTGENVGIARLPLPILAGNLILLEHVSTALST